MTRFRNRGEAGRKLAAELRVRTSERPIVLALPRGGVPVGYEVARALHAPLDVWVVRKVGLPWHEELGIGAVAEDGYRYINQDTLALSGLSQQSLHELVKTKERDVEERVRRFRGDRGRPELRDRTVIVVDDGIATGGTARAAIGSIRAQAPKAIILAVPVASRESFQALAPQVDRVVCLQMPAELYAIGVWYFDFSQVSDDEVVRLLERARAELEEEQSRGATA